MAGGCDGSNYHEYRWFRPWIEDGGYAVVDFELPLIIKQIKG